MSNSDPNDPKVWGPHFWFVMKSAVDNFPLKASSQVQKQYINFFTSLKEILPCEDCKGHYTHLLKQYPIENYIHSPQELTAWYGIIYQNSSKKTKEKPQVPNPSAPIQNPSLLPSAPVAKPPIPNPLTNLPKFPLAKSSLFTKPITQLPTTTTATPAKAKPASLSQTPSPLPLPSSLPLPSFSPITKPYPKPQYGKSGCSSCKSRKNLYN